MGTRNVHEHASGTPGLFWRKESFVKSAHTGRRMRRTCCKEWCSRLSQCVGQDDTALDSVSGSDARSGINSPVFNHLAPATPAQDQHQQAQSNQYQWWNQDLKGETWERGSRLMVSFWEGEKYLTNSLLLQEKARFKQIEASQKIVSSWRT